MDEDEYHELRDIVQEMRARDLLPMVPVYRELPPEVLRKLEAVKRMRLEKNLRVVEE